MIFISFVFQGLPETAALIFTSFAIVGYNPKVREIIIYSLTLVSLIYFFRLFPGVFGLHTLVGVIALVILICRVAKVSLGVSFFAAFSTMFLLFFLETIVHLLFVNIVGNVSRNQELIWVIIGWPQIAGLVGTGILIRKIRPIVIKSQRWLNEKQVSSDKPS
ncbi:hypothetical protein [Desulforamulus ferrireducens]|uniref:Uncharacterized protein n=1 Tax=Desulforamulus ferrireducens TaxID=1833852 RepID=A0A1S6IZ45_9FIRM|nr:hypothetical protein [Desulforamulus ferrireducens]AQS60043.1 hypothetical protein B0537_13755 [Desulforamulus ferrireducens]